MIEDWVRHLSRFSLPEQVEGWEGALRTICKFLAERCDRREDLELFKRTREAKDWKARRFPDA